MVQTTSQTSNNLTNISKRTNNITTSHADIYSIPCNDWDKYYIDETQLNLNKRIYENKGSIRLNDNPNALFSHMLNFNFSQVTLIKQDS